MSPWDRVPMNLQEPVDLDGGLHVNDKSIRVAFGVSALSNIISSISIGSKARPSWLAGAVVVPNGAIIDKYENDQYSDAPVYAP